MVKQPEGFWTVTTAPLVPGFHYYTVVVDGAEFSDPSSHTFFGGGKDASGIEVPERAPVRYAWQSDPAATLYSGAGLPAVPFRTDKWPGKTEGHGPY